MQALKPAILLGIERCHFISDVAGENKAIIRVIDKKVRAVNDQEIDEY
jgi:hypothetical protein